jgi:hypothetical protein
MDVLTLIDKIEEANKRYAELLSGLDSTFNTPSHLKLTAYLRWLTEMHDEVVDLRLRKILKEEHPYLPEINSPGSMQYSPYKNHTLQDISRIFLQYREDLLNFLYDVPVDAWERSGVHEKEGHVTFKEFVRRMIEKDHTAHIQLKQFLNTHEKPHV